MRLLFYKLKNNNKANKYPMSIYFEVGISSCGSVFNLLKDYKFNHVVEIETGICKDECEKILKDFFKMLRKLKK